jgi:hypothetical protein
VSFKVLGAHEIAGKLRRGAQGQARAEFGRAAVGVFQQMLLPVVIAETPVETGALRSTEHVVGPEIRGNQIDVSIVAGGPVAEHAYIVHEDPDAYHPIGDWKYIERPLAEWSPHMGGHIARRIDLNKVVR